MVRELKTKRSKSGHVTVMRTIIVPLDIWEDIGRICSESSVPMSRAAWIVMAADKELKRIKKDDDKQH